MSGAAAALARPLAWIAPAWRAPLMRGAVLLLALAFPAFGADEPAEPTPKLRWHTTRICPVVGAAPQPGKSAGLSTM